jgi:DNA-binding CsgD family transcriptional regulator
MLGAAPRGNGSLVGRTDELGAVIDLVRAAAGGRSGNLLVSGEPGVGKTALMRSACSQTAEEADLVWGSCLPLTLTTPFQPLVSGAREWNATRGEPWSAVLDGPVTFDHWLDMMCRRRPMLLVVDDVQWADQSSLDVLMYVIAGPEQRRLALVTTMRTGEVPNGHPLRRWLADVRRLPRVGELRLGRLDRVTTGRQIGAVLGAPPRETLVEEVYALSRGNPYLTRLLVRALSPDAVSLPAGLPTDLSDALARTWHGLSLPARELMRLTAIGGRPQRADRIGTLAARDVVPLLREAVDAGVLTVDDHDRYWFAHPLLAEVLVNGLLPEERRGLHAMFAAVLRGDTASGVEQVIDLADHYHAAGDSGNAFRWALRAAEVAQRCGGAAEMLRLLRRAYDLWQPEAGTSAAQIDLLHRIRAAAEQAGEHEQELNSVDSLLAVLDRGSEPLKAAELLVRRMRLLFMTGRKFASRDEVGEAVRLTAPYPASPQHALATAELAYTELWHGIPTGPDRAQDAIHLARACGSARALSYALTASVMALLLNHEPCDPAVAQEAKTVAVKARDYTAFVHASVWQCNCIDVHSAPAVLDILRRAREELTSLGGPHSYIAWLCALEADALLIIGDWRACVRRLRVALGASPGPFGDVTARLIAARLACWQGRYAEAQGHLARAEEIFPHQSEFLNFYYDAVHAELALATGELDLAFMHALAAASREIPPDQCERLLPLAARALADQIQQARDRGEDPASAQSRLRDLRNRFPEVLADHGPDLPLYGRQLEAMQAIYDAEVLRGQHDPAAGRAWHHAARACRAGALAWDEMYASWRAAQAMLPNRSDRDAAATALRRAHRLAVDLHAAPLQQDVEELARTARVPLTKTSTPVEQVPVLPQFTNREQEMLSYILAGRTYRQIARSLVLSEKTVSTHISNMLRKTGTSNRLELAELARRLARKTATEQRE